MLFIHKENIGSALFQKVLEETAQNFSCNDICWYFKGKFLTSNILPQFVICISASSDSGSTILFLQFSFIALEGLVVQYWFGRQKRHIPLKSYVSLMALFFASSATNNIALGFSIPMPLHMIFKSGSLVANMCLGAILLKRSYSWSKYISVALVSFGIFICTLITGMDSTNGKHPEDEALNLTTVLTGTLLMTISLFLSARMGIYQETLALKYGKHSREALFYNHILPLPLFIFLLPSIQRNILIFNNSQSSSVPFFSNIFDISSRAIFSFPSSFELPILWQFLIVNIITQYFCIRSVFYLMSECTSLTVTLLITLRKFVSLVFSVLYFNNKFSVFHWFGTVFVFCGSLIYSDVINIDFLLHSTKKRKLRVKKDEITNVNIEAKKLQ